MVFAAEHDFLVQFSWWRSPQRESYVLSCQDISYSWAYAAHLRDSHRLDVHTVSETLNSEAASSINFVTCPFREETSMVVGG